MQGEESYEKKMQEEMQKQYLFSFTLDSNKK